MNWQDISDSGLLALIVSVLFSLFRYINPLIYKQLQKQKANKAYAAYNLLDKFAENAVAYMATQYEMPSADKQKAATERVAKQLADHGVEIDAQNVQMAIEKAYQYFTTQNTKAQQKQGDFNDGLANAESQAAQPVADPNESIDTQLAKMEANISLADTTPTKGSDDNA